MEGSEKKEIPVTLEPVSEGDEKIVFSNIERRKTSKK